MSGEEKRVQVRAQVEALPERQRQVIELRHVEGCSHSEIAERLGISEGNSRVIYNRALNELRGKIDSEDV